MVLKIRFISRVKTAPVRLKKKGVIRGKKGGVKGAQKLD